MIEFFLAIVPSKATSQSAGKRIVVVSGKPMFFKNNQATSAENDLTSLCSVHAPTTPMLGALMLNVDFVWPWRKSEPMKNRQNGYMPMTTKPDCSNAVKMIEDVLTRLQFWQDDAQVACLTVTKGWGNRPGIKVRIQQLNVSAHTQKERVRRSENTENK